MSSCVSPCPFSLPAVKHHHRHHATPEKMKRCQPPPSQKAVHPVQLQMDCVGGSQSIGCSAWDDYDFTPVYIWVPKRQRQQSKVCNWLASLIGRCRWCSRQNSGVHGGQVTLL